MSAPTTDKFKVYINFRASIITKCGIYYTLKEYIFTGIKFHKFCEFLSISRKSVLANITEKQSLCEIRKI